MIKSEWSIVYIEGTHRLYKKVFLFLKFEFVLVNHADPDEMLQNFYLGLHGLLKYPSRGFWSTKGLIIVPPQTKIIRAQKLTPHQFNIICCK